MTELTTLRNIGLKSALWLQDVGITTPEELAQVGSVAAYRRVRDRYPDRVNLNLLWSLEGALLDIPWNRLPDEVKSALREQLAIHEGQEGQ